MKTAALFPGILLIAAMSLAPFANRSAAQSVLDAGPDPLRITVEPDLAPTLDAGPDPLRITVEPDQAPTLDPNRASPRSNATPDPLQSNVEPDEGPEPVPTTRRPRGTGFGPEPTRPAQKFLSEDGIWSALVGNTIETLPRTNVKHEPVFMYFGTDGQAEYATARSGVRRGTWWIIQGARIPGPYLCRKGTVKSPTDQFCERITLDGDKANFFNERRPPERTFSAKILGGRQLP